MRQASGVIGIAAGAAFETGEARSEKKKKKAARPARGLEDEKRMRAQSLFENG